MIAEQCCSYEQEERPSSEDVEGWLLDLLEEMRANDDDANIPIPPLPSIKIIQEMQDMIRAAERENEEEGGEETSEEEEKMIGDRIQDDNQQNEEDEDGRDTPPLTQPQSGIRSRNDSQSSSTSTSQKEESDQQQSSESSVMATHKRNESAASIKKKSKRRFTTIACRGFTSRVEGFVEKEGWLAKRNRHGFRNWKKRWFVLIRNQLFWFNSPDEPDAHGCIDIRGCVLKTTKQYRWQINNPEDNNNNIASNASNNSSNGKKQQQERVRNREIAASSEREMLEWMNVLQRMIEECGKMDMEGGGGKEEDRNRFESFPPNPISPSHGEYKTQDSSGGRGGGGGGGRRIESPRLGVGGTGIGVTNINSNFSSVEQWLISIEMETYAPLFIEKGYDKVGMMLSMGLSDDDLDFLGIQPPLHRRILKTACASSYTNSLVINILEWKDFGGVVVYVVESQYLFSKSRVMLRYSNFTKLNAALKRALTSTSNLPNLPGKGVPLLQDQHSEVFINARKDRLEEYLQGLTIMLHGSEHHPILFEWLGLQ